MIVININKAKVIAHDMRRAARSKEFEPYDEIISKQIPGAALQNAEAERQAIRDKYAQIQTQLNAAQSPEELKSILNI
jgi:ABC-type phosphate transport system auxiliary subunit